MVVLPITPRDFYRGRTLTVGINAIRVQAIVSEEAVNLLVTLSLLVGDEYTIVFTDFFFLTIIGSHDNVVTEVFGLLKIEDRYNGEYLVLVDGARAVVISDNPHFLSDRFLVFHIVVVLLLYMQRPCQ
jgi:hypothetical protein